MVDCQWYLTYFCLICCGCWFSSAAPRVQDAFSDDINSCLFSSWKSVISGKVQCQSYGSDFKELCYGLSKTQAALFVVCYDTKKLIPVFTAHVVEPVAGGHGGRRPKFKKDRGRFRPRSQAKDADYTVNKQIKLYPEFVKYRFYCARGHLVPNADFVTDEQRATTFTLTNAAPQWQKFNAGNWVIMENAVREYSLRKQRDLYVFTGTGGEAINDSTGAVYKLNGKVTAPKYFWILVCDVKIRQMVIFVGTNPVGNSSEDRKKGCNGSYHTENRGVMQCYSYNQVKKNSKYSDFKLPSMNTSNCPINTKGTFLNPKFS